MYAADPKVVGGGALAVTGLGLPIGWYFTAAVVLMVVGFIVVRATMRHRRRLEAVE